MAAPFADFLEIYIEIDQNFMGIGGIK